ncbi:aspartyl protease family protein [Arcicella lustrica]|uniref:Aspartyl protease family protein n=1 Tax=Arcicella lustrica TaxID=2984196 RepID=A0ABU5SIQ6_9BACT|nr:aspartyl protease family protein [Arcicella sp. DC25W]MEA5427186.1 aspartyl protease family protein [Arcicella sp. DC25W]
MKLAWHKILLFSTLPLAGYCQDSTSYAEQNNGGVRVSTYVRSERPKKLKFKPAIEENFGFQLVKKRKISVIPFELHANLVIVPIRINNSDTLRFILDTGVSSIIVTDSKVAEKQGMLYSRNVKIAGVGVGNDLEAGIVIDNTIKMGDVIGYRQNIVVLKNDILKLSEFVGKPIHGIIGYDLFNRFAVTIDFSVNQIVLENPEHYKYKTSKGQRFPITIEENKPYLDAVELVNGDQTVPIKVLLDTGAGHAISIEVNKKFNIQLPPKVVKAQLGRGLSGIINGNLGRLPKIKFGKYELNNVVASFPDSSSYHLKPTNFSERQGNIGCEFLRRFKVTFNYRDKYVVLKPINRRMKEPFEHNMSGMELLASGSDYHEFLIERIIENSPAHLAGLQQGDRVIFINNKSYKDISITDIYKIFQKGEGKPISMVVKRGQEVIFTTVNLKRLI